MEKEADTTTSSPSVNNSPQKQAGKSLFFLKSLFFNNHNHRPQDAAADGEPAAATGTGSFSPKSIPNLSPLAISVISRCSKILQISTEEIHNRFDAALPDSHKQSSSYARSFLEFCSYEALHLLTRRPDYLSDKDFRQLTYDMMLAWESSGIENITVDNEIVSRCKQDAEDEEGWSLFYSSPINMAVQVDGMRTVGPEAFARIAPACPVVADIITVDNLFDALTTSSGHRLHFLIYDMYLRSLEKVIKSVNNAYGPESNSNLQLAEEEIILDTDGTIPTQPVLQHTGISAWPGRLTLTNYAIYFESLGVGIYEKAVRYDLAKDMKQVIKPDLTGPLGARLFDKAVMYKSTFMAEPVYLEFPEFKGSSRRDYWLDICLEILRAHRFMRKYKLKDVQQSEALARAILGIIRNRAVREAFKMFSSQYKSLLCFNLAENLPGGDKILETLSTRLLVNASSSRRESVGSPNSKGKFTLPFSLLTLCRLGIISRKIVDVDGEVVDPIGDVCVGETNPLEMAVKDSKRYIGRAEAAQETVDQVKVDGIDTNLAVMKELLRPLTQSCKRLQAMASWENPTKSTIFLVLTSYTILRGWIRYILPCTCVLLAILMLWRRHANKVRVLKPFEIIAPPNRNAVEQLVTLQETISQVEALVQSANITLLKVRALLFSALPQATGRIALLLLFMALAFAIVPMRYLSLFFFLEVFTREFPLRKDSSDRWLRRMREWWFRIPAAPVQLIRPDDKKRR